MASETEFYRLSHPAHGTVYLSLEAIVLNSAAIADSLKSEQPGFVSDEFLSRWPVNVTVCVAELCTSAFWERINGGYSIYHPLMDVLASEKGN